MTKALTKGARITGPRREALAAQFSKRYSKGQSIRRIAEDVGRSFGFIHGILVESGTVLRGRGGATRGRTKAAARSSAKEAAAASRARRPGTSGRAAAKKTAATTAARKTAGKAASVRR